MPYINTLQTSNDQALAWMDAQEPLEHVRNIQVLRDYISKQPINHN